MHLIKATIKDAELIWNMQIEAFAELLEKWQDLDTNPGNEPLEKVIKRLEQPETYFYLLELNENIAGAVRVVDKKDNLVKKRISPLFLLPQYRNRGLAQKAIIEIERIHGNENWELETILQEPGNCYLYEKMGYRPTGKQEQVNTRMTLISYEK